MANEAARAALRERAATPLPLVRTEIVLGGVEVYVRALPFRQAMRIRAENPDDDDDTAEARIIVRCIYDSEGELLLDPLDPQDLEVITAQKHQDFWIQITRALAEGASPKASAQTTSS
jgi:hypothetical protein